MSYLRDSTVDLPVRPHEETMYWQANANTPLSATSLLNVPDLSGLPNANAKSLRFTYAISQTAPLPPVVALNRSSKSQIATRYAAFWHAISQIALASFL